MKSYVFSASEILCFMTTEEAQNSREDILEKRIAVLESTIARTNEAHMQSIDVLTKRVESIALLLAEHKRTSVLLASDTEQAVVDMNLSVSQAKQEVYSKLHATEKQLSNIVESHTADMNRFVHDKVDELVLQISDKLSHVKSLGANIVQWVITKRHSSLSSPRFNIAGIAGVKFELLYAKPPDRDLPDCGLSLWAPPGSFLIFTLRAGNLSRKFQHQFPRTAAESSFGALAFRTDDVIDGDSFSVSVEIHESQSEIIENSITSFFDFSFFKFSDFLQSRDCRKVEWRLNPTDLEISSGARVSSDLFNLAGIHSLQLIFYPTGHLQPDSTTCSCYISAPAGTRMSGQLAVGSVRRRVDFDSTDNSTDREGFGRGCFCLNNRVGELLISFELFSAEQETFDGRVIKVGKSEKYSDQILVLNKISQTSRKWPTQIR